MTSELKVDKISPATGTGFTLGDSGDTFTVPSGATITNSGTATGFGEMTLLSTTTLSGTSTSISVSATGYLKLLIFGFGLDGSSSVSDTYIRFNSDSGNNYKFVRMNGDNGNNSGQSTQLTSGIYINMNGVYGYASGGNISFYAEIFDPTSTSHWKNVLVNAVGEYSTGQNIQLVSGAYLSNSAITSLQLNSSTSLTAGTIKIYGVK